jgi:AcrR family transcriptional regulator
LGVDDSTHGERRKAAIIEAGLALWRIDPVTVSARKIGAKLGMTHSAVLYHFDNADGLKNAIASEAVRIGDGVIVPQLIAARHPAAAGIAPADRRRYLASC